MTNIPQKTVEDVEEEDDSSKEETSSEEEEESEEETETEEEQEDDVIEDKPEVKVMHRKLVTLEARSPRKSDQGETDDLETNASLAHLSRVLQFSDSEDEGVGDGETQAAGRIDRKQEAITGKRQAVSDVHLHTKQSKETAAHSHHQSEEEEEEEQGEENGEEDKEDGGLLFGDDEDAWDESARQSDDDTPKQVIRKPAVTKTKCMY